MSFQLKHNLSIITLILILVGIIGLLSQVFGYLFAPPRPSSNLSVQPPVATPTQDYVEKIDNFSLQNFDAKHQLLHFIEAKHYFKSKDAPALLLEPKVRMYDKTGAEAYFLSAKRAHYLDNAQVKFSGRVNIHSKTGVTHTINTQALLVNTQTHDLSTNTPITYLDKRMKVEAQGMQMQAHGEKIKLTGEVKITQQGAQLLAKNIYIDRTDGQQHYYSKHKVIYTAENNKIYADSMDMNAQKALLWLLGNVKILQNSGAQIHTQNLLIDQSNGQDIYQTKHNIRYKSKAANISAKGMRYATKSQKIKLTGGVLGRYNNQ